LTIIGIGHVARSGKDTAANALARDLGYTKVAFADKLKELALHTAPIITGQIAATNVQSGRGRLDWAVQGMGWDEAKNVYPEVRRFLQLLGEGARNLFGEDFWVEQALGGVKGNVVVSDVRYPNEAEAVKAKGGFLIKVERPGYVAQGHVSETALADFDGWDAVIVNDGTVVELEDKVVATVKGLVKK
jgi:hypothetical protein